MSFPTIPNITPTISLPREDVVNLLLSSIAFEELGLAHIINAEAEKIQFSIGTIIGQTTLVPPTLKELERIDKSVEHNLRTLIKQEMLLQFKLENVLDISTTTTTTTTTSTTTTSTTTTTPCTAIVHEDVCVQAEIAIIPNVTVGNIQYYCEGAPSIKACPGTQSSTGPCTFILSQNICIEVPLTFSATATVSSTGIICGTPVVGTCTGELKKL
ncbi:MAG: hypothetical protein Q8934_07430 [Bacillota bacterium]|nr:hypothetical protein [Bacillota bacterium]